MSILHSRLSLTTSRIFQGCVCLHLLQITCGAAPVTNAVREPEEIRALVNMIVEGVNDNLSRLGAVELMFEGTHQANVEALERVLGKPLSTREKRELAPDPRVEKYKYILSDGKVRFEPRLDSGRRSLFLYVDGSVTHYEPSTKHAWVQASKESPRFYPPVRLRQIGFHGADFPECLLDWNCTGAEFSVGDKDDTKVTLTHERGVQEKSISKTEFSSRLNYLPTRRLFYHAGGSIKAVVSFEYVQVVPRQAWVLSRFTRTLFPEDVNRDEQNPERDGWSQRQELRLIDSHTVENVPSSAFDVVFPDGTVVMDSVKNRNYAVRIRTPEAETASPLRWTFWVCGISLFVVTGIAVLILRRRLARSR